MKERNDTTTLSLVGALCAAACMLAACGGASPATRTRQSAGGASSHSLATAVSAKMRAPATAYALREVGRAGIRQLPTPAGQPNASTLKSTGGHARRQAAPNAAAPGGTAAGPRSQSAGLGTDLAALPAGSGTSAIAVGEPTGGGGPPLNPCSLVTPGEARRIIGGPIARAVERPLGPTCVYQPSHAKAEITLAVELMNYSAVKRMMTNGAPVTVGRLHAFCGELGGTTHLVVSLGNSVVLHVDAPCALARKFAAIALGRVG